MMFVNLLVFCGAMAAGLLSCADSPKKDYFYLYKVTTIKLWQNSQDKDHLQLSPSDQDFIHFAEEGDVERIAKKFFSNEQTVMVLKIDPAMLEGTLVKEKNPGGQKEYYHLYNGKIPRQAVIESKTLTDYVR